MSDGAPAVRVILLISSLLFQPQEFEPGPFDLTLDLSSTAPPQFAGGGPRRQ